MCEKVHAFASAHSGRILCWDLHEHLCTCCLHVCIGTCACMVHVRGHTQMCKGLRASGKLSDGLGYCTQLLKFNKLRSRLNNDATLPTPISEPVTSPFLARCGCNIETTEVHLVVATVCRPCAGERSLRYAQELLIHGVSHHHGPRLQTARGLPR